MSPVKIIVFNFLSLILFITSAAFSFIESETMKHPEYSLSIETNIFVLFVISALLYIVIAYIKEISYKLNSTTTKGIPIPYKSFIKTDGEVINMNEEDMEEAMLYLADVEEYLKSKGWL